MLEKVESGQFERAKLWEWLQAGVTREEVRRLFERLDSNGNGGCADRR